MLSVCFPAASRQRCSWFMIWWSCGGHTVFRYVTKYVFSNISQLFQQPKQHAGHKSGVWCWSCVLWRPNYPPWAAPPRDVWADQHSLLTERKKNVAIERDPGSNCFLPNVVLAVNKNNTVQVVQYCVRYSSYIPDSSSAAALESNFHFQWRMTCTAERQSRIWWPNEFCLRRHLEVTVSTASYLHLILTF